MEASGYKFLEHVTDALVEAWGHTLEEAFSQSGIALFETMIDTANVQPRLIEEIHTTGHDQKELLYNYLEELLLLFEVKQLAVGKISAVSIAGDQQEMHREAEVSGEKFDRQKHNGRVEVKGITYHMMDINKVQDKVTVRFLLDL